jgi:hypothetical protein
MGVLQQALGVVVFLGIVRIVHDYVVYPRIIDLGMPLHPFAVIVAVLCGAALAGVPESFWRFRPPRSCPSGIATGWNTQAVKGW